MHALVIAVTIAIRGVTLVDVDAGTTRPDSTVVIRDGRVTTDKTIPEGATIVEGRGKFLIPGLWDMHVHLSSARESALPALIANGITGVRDLGGRLGEIDAMRARVEAGSLAGPRIFRAGPILNGQAFNELQMVVANADEARGAVRTLKHVGVDFIKTHRRTSREAYFALVDEAKKNGLSLVGHIPMTVTPEEASDAGQLTIEHTETLFEGTFGAGINDSALRAPLIAKIAKNGNAVTPQLVAYSSIFEPPDPALVRYVAKTVRKTEPPVTGADAVKWRDNFAKLREVVRELNAAGVTLLAGSDVAQYRVPGFTLHQELELLVGSGLTPLQALRAATVNPIRVMKQDASRADLVLLDANPLTDIRNTRRIHAVIAAGRLYRRADLDALLKQAVELAARN